MQALIKARDEFEPYFDACARLRDISKTALLTRLLDVIGRDQLVLSVLDDESKPDPKRKKGTHGYRPKASADRPRYGLKTYPL